MDFFSENSAFYGSLATQHQLGGAGFFRLLEAFGSAEGVYAAGPEALLEAHPKLSPAVLNSLAPGPDRGAWVKLAEDCAARNILITAPGWPGYPEPLRTLEGPPPILFIRGAWRAEDARAVALVGTRMPTEYGREAAFTLARDFAARGHTVVSGLALGVDAAAHAGALDAGGRTIAVIGCGHDIEYPVENRAVRARIEERAGENGAVISEHPPGTQAWPSNFPRRNRLISGLARAVIVVEAGGKSGALLTAAHALHQKKALFAVPGPIFSPVSTGTAALLRKGALPATSADGVLRELDGVVPGRRIARAAPHAIARAEPARVESVGKGRNARPRRVVAEVPAPPDDPVLALWRGDEACALDALASRAVERGMWPRESAAAALLERLLQLELRGLVRRLPGAAYRLTGRGGL